MGTCMMDQIIEVVLQQRNYIFIKKNKSMTFNRYSQVSGEGEVGFPPVPKYRPMPFDKEELWILNKSRMDLISSKYYNGDANYDWLIMWANPTLPKIEFEIPDHTYIRIPFPLEEALAQYKNGIESYKQLYYID